MNANRITRCLKSLGSYLRRFSRQNTPPSDTKKAGVTPRFPSIPTALRHRRLLLPAVCAVLAVLLWLMWPAQHGTPSGSYRPQRITQTLPEQTVSPQPVTGSYRQDATVEAGEDLAAVLARMGVPDAQIRDITRSSAIDPNILLKANQNLSIRFDAAGHPNELQFFSDNDNGEQVLLRFNKTPSGWKADTVEPHTETLSAPVSVQIRTSARGALAQAGVPVDIRAALSELFRNRPGLDSLQDGDRIRLIYDTVYYQGLAIATGNIRGAEITHNGQTYQAFYYDPDGSGSGRYYDGSGKPLMQEFTAVPVANARISSPFGLRRHPILHTLLMHTGIDYAAPSGTPIHAPADGVVDFIGRKGGYGNTIILRHSDSKTTLYGHMSGFADLQAGFSVRAGDIIGYVGATGRATGPHLHYEVRINGEPVNPTGVALPVPPLDAAGLAAFAQEKRRYTHWFAQLRRQNGTVTQMD